MNPFKAVYHAARSFADGVQLGLKIIGWDEPTDIGAEQLCEREAMEEVHPPRCNCFSADRVDEFVDTAIENLNELLARFNHDEPPPVAAYRPTDLTDAERRTVVDALNSFRDGFVPNSVHWNAITELYERIRTSL